MKNKKVKILHENVVSELKKYNNSWIELGMKLVELTDEIEGKDVKISWKSTFQVSNFSEYCTVVLKKDYEKMIKIRMAAKCMKNNRNELYDEYVNDKKVNIPGYSLIYVVESKKKKLNEWEKYDELIGNLWPGDYNVYTTNSNIGTIIYYDGQNNILNADVLEVIGNETIYNIDFTLTDATELPVGTITGSIELSNQNFLEGEVVIFASMIDEIIIVAAVYPSATDYSITVTTGEYKIGAYYYGYENYPNETWFDNAPDFESAQIVTVVENQVISDINLIFEPCVDYTLDVVGNNRRLPNEYILYTNYPNPFNPVTTLRYDLPEDAMVNITIYDMMGRVVSNLVSSQQNAGYKSIQWNATNAAGQPVAAGLYLYTIQAGQFKQTKKMVLLK